MCDFKIEERTARVRFEITGMISDQNFLSNQFNYHFITFILKSPKYRTWSVQISNFWGGEKKRVLETKVAKFVT